MAYLRTLAEMHIEESRPTEKHGRKDELMLPLFILLEDGHMRHSAANKHGEEHC